MIPQTAPYLRTLCTISVALRFNKEGRLCWGVGGEAPVSGGNGGLGAEPPAANEFLRFSHKKTVLSAHFIMEKGHTGSLPAVSADCAVTIIVSDNTKAL